MFYTLLKFLGWGLVLAVIGGCVGWALRSLKCRGQLAKARRTDIDTEEADRMRDRLADLEQVVAERDRLRMQVADMRHTDSPGVVGTTADEGARLLGSGPEPSVNDDSSDQHAEPVDLHAGAVALGRRIELDDLTVVEGIGPKIAELCTGVGITTWRQLADADVAILRSMLDDAGSRYRVHDPESWPRQAGLLAEGRWEEFTALTDELRSGR